jgi:Mn-dependent DtxR family transcriptional regulator
MITSNPVKTFTSKSWTLDSLDKAKRVVESWQYKKTTERLEYLIGYYPEFINLTHKEMAHFLGVNRDAVTKAMNKLGYRRRRSYGIKKETET